MKCHFKINIFLFALLAWAVVLFFGAVIGLANTELQQQKPAVQAQEQEAEPEYSEDEYNCYDSAAKEPDLQKRGTMLIECIGKYPKSKLMTYIDAAYKSLLFECSNNKKYQELEILAEQWLKLHPNDFDTIARIAEAAEKLGHDEKYVQCLQELHKMRPQGDLAINIAQTYKKMKNNARYLEWIETVFKYPEYEGNFMLRYDLVKFYTDAQDYAKAAEYARVTLKSGVLVKDPSAQTKEQLRAVQNACHHLIGINLYENKKYAEAIESFQQALKAEKYGEGYFYIGQCLRQLDKIDDAMIYLAKAELQGGKDIAPKAKENLETLYKAIHNNTLIGIEKIYRKAKEPSESAENLK